MAISVTGLDRDRNGLEILDRQTCLELLAMTTLGRVGITFGALPVILPVNYRLLGDRIVFRTGIGTKLDAAVCNEIVAFEIDGVDSMTRTGWSVIATGLAQVVESSGSRARLAAAHIPRWAPATEDKYVEISTEMLSGRRIRHDGF